MPKIAPIIHGSGVPLHAQSAPPIADTAMPSAAAVAFGLVSKL
jgi:hypothetical protein